MRWAGKYYISNYVPLYDVTSITLRVQLKREKLRSRTDSAHNVSAEASERRQSSTPLINQASWTMLSPRRKNIQN